MNKFLIGNFAIETRNARLNGSSAEVDQRFGDDTNNTSYTKKISIENKQYPYASGQHVKFNIKRYYQALGRNVSTIQTIKSNISIGDCHPAKNIDEDILGFMIALNTEISIEQYENLTEEKKFGFTPTGKDKYKKSITKKRKSRLMLSPLQAIQDTKILKEFATKHTDANNNLYRKEVYAAIMSSGFNLHLSEIGKFLVSTDASGFRDYDVSEAEFYGLNEDNGLIVLSREERLQRIIDTLEAFRNYHSTAGQNNNLEDLTPKFIIFGEYSIGNNIFNNIFREGVLDLEYLKEAIEENEEFSLSPIFIGIRSGFMDNLREKVSDYFEGNSNIVISSVGEAFSNYYTHLTKTFK